MTKNGFIVIHRKITDWEWYTDANTFKVFMHLLLTANFSDQKFKGMTIKRGQRVASYESLAKETGLSVQNVKTAIKHLKLTNEVTSHSTSQFTVFSIVKYGDYQNKQPTNQPTANQRLTNDQPTANHDITMINNGNTVYNDENIAAHNVGRTEPPDGQCPGGIVYGNEGEDA